MGSEGSNKWPGMGQFLQNSHSVKISKNAVPLDTDIIRNRILPIWVPPSEKQGGNMQKMSENPVKTAKKAKN
jgi:hypothetical protein